MDKPMMDMAASALKNAAAKKPAQKAKLRMTIKPTDNDRFVVDHESMGSEGMQPPTQHSLNDVDELVEHVKKSYGKKAAAKEEKSEPAAEKMAEAAAAEKA
jgi:hypothetical protein